MKEISSYAKFILQKWLNEVAVYPWDAVDIPPESIYYIVMGYMLNKVPIAPPIIQVFDCNGKLNISLGSLCSKLISNKTSDKIIEEEDSISSMEED